MNLKGENRGVARAEMGLCGRRRWSCGEAVARTKMGRQGVKEARGGLGVVGEASWRRGDGERQPAVEVERGAGGGREQEGNYGAHGHE